MLIQVNPSPSQTDSAQAHTLLWSPVVFKSTVLPVSHGADGVGKPLLPREAHMHRRALALFLFFLLHSTHTQTHFSVWKNTHYRNTLGTWARKWEGHGRTLLLVFWQPCTNPQKVSSLSLSFIPTMKQWLFNPFGLKSHWRLPKESMDSK